MDPQRRSFLEFAALGLGGALLPAIPPGVRLLGGADPIRSRRAGLTFEEFLAEAVPVARELVKDTSRIGEDRYLLALASHAVRLRDVPVPELRENTFPVGAKARSWIGANEIPKGMEEIESPFVVLHWRLEPGAEIGQHPHLYGNVVTLCLEGELRVRNFECADVRDLATKQPFRVRQVQDQVMRTGSINLVPLEHGYTHGFVAGPGGARGLDITTRIRERLPSPILQVSDEPLEDGGTIYEGKWVYR